MQSFFSADIFLLASSFLFLDSLPVQNTSIGIGKSITTPNESVHSTGDTRNITKGLFVAREPVNTRGESVTGKSDPTPNAPTIQYVLGSPEKVFHRNNSRLESRLGRVVCNFNISSESRNGSERFNIDDLEVRYCTDIYYDYVPLDSFALGKEVVLQLWPFNEVEPTPRFSKLNHHKLVKPELVSFLTVAEGGGGLPVQHDGFHGNPNAVPLKAEAEDRRITSNTLGFYPGMDFRFLVEHEELLLTFSDWATHLLRLWGFDGLALRWPQMAGPSRLLKLLVILRTHFHHEHRERSSQRGSGSLPKLQIAVLLDTSLGDRLRYYDMSVISHIVDQVTLEAIPSSSDQDDYVTRIVQPLYKMSDTGVPLTPRLSIEEAIKIVVHSGISRHKLNIAISLVGMGFLLKNPANNSVGAETTGLMQPSQIFYYKTCDLMTNATVVRASSRDLSPYLVRGDLWISYEDDVSLEQKINYLKNKSVGGVALFSQSEDDFAGTFCDKGKFPLSVKVYEYSDVLQGGNQLMLPWQRYCSSAQSPQMGQNGVVWSGGIMLVVLVVAS